MPAETGMTCRASKLDQIHGRLSRPYGGVMAEMTIRLQYDPETGKKDIIVTLRSDADLLPHEHEQQHRALVERLIEGGLVTADELGQVIVSREEEQSLAASDPADELSSEQRDQSDDHRSQSESG